MWSFSRKIKIFRYLFYSNGRFLLQAACGAGMSCIISYTSSTSKQVQLSTCHHHIWLYITDISCVLKLHVNVSTGILLFHE